MAANDEKPEQAVSGKRTARGAGDHAAGGHDVEDHARSEKAHHHAADLPTALLDEDPYAIEDQGQIDDNRARDKNRVHLLPLSAPKGSHENQDTDENQNQLPMVPDVREGIMGSGNRHYQQHTAGNQRPPVTLAFV